MSGSSPSDLSVTFRSIERRLAEALEPVGGDRAAVAGLVAELDGVVAAAAAIVGAGSGGRAVADAIDARPADAWQDEELATLRTHALDVGRLLRAIAAAAEEAAASR